MTNEKAPERVWLHAMLDVATNPCGCDKDVEYVRVDLLATASKKETEIAQGIVREWAEHDMNEHYNSDYLRDEFGSEHLETRIATALATIRADERSNVQRSYNGDLISRTAAKAAMCYMCAKPDRYKPAQAIEGSERLVHFQGSDNWNPGECLAQPLNSIAAATAAPVGHDSIPLTTYERILTIEWDKYNARRHELIKAERSRVLSESEVLELFELQWLARIKQGLSSGPRVTQKQPLPDRFLCINPEEQSTVINFLRGYGTDADRELARLHLNLCLRCQGLANAAPVEQYYCPEHKYTPPPNSGLALCPQCETAALDRSTSARAAAEEIASLSYARHRDEKVVQFTEIIQRYCFPAESVGLDELVDEVQKRMDQVVDAAVEWHQAGREGGEWFEAAEKLGAAIDSLIELRTEPSKAQ